MGILLFAKQAPLVAPIPTPLQAQIHGPVPKTTDGEPAEQRLVDGIETNFCLSEEPQAPLVIWPCILATQFSVDPKFIPEQVQVYVVPLVITEDSMPALQRFVVGSEETIV